jgi:hypothetical protein
MRITLFSASVANSESALRPAEWTALLAPLRGPANITRQIASASPEGPAAHRVGRAIALEDRLSPV